MNNGIRLSYLLNFIIVMAMGAPIFIFARNTIRSSNDALFSQIKSTQENSTELATLGATIYFHSVKLNVSYLASDLNFISAIKSKRKNKLDKILSKTFSSMERYRVSHLFLSTKTERSLSSVYSTVEGSGKQLALYDYPLFFDKKIKVYSEDQESFYLIYSHPVIDQMSGRVIASLNAAVYVGANSFFLNELARISHSDNVLITTNGHLVTSLGKVENRDVMNRIKNQKLFIEDYIVYNSFSTFFDQFSHLQVTLKTKNESLKSLEEKYSEQKMFAYMLVAFLTLIFYILVKVLVTDPIERLVYFSRSPGDYKVTRIIEFDSIYRAIKNSFGEIQNVNTNLERIVTERTEQLQDKNLELNSTIEKMVGLQKSMVAQERLASIGTVMAGISHELKNPLNIIINSAKIMISKCGGLPSENKNETRTKEMLTELTSIIHKHSSSANDTIESMLSKSRGRDFSSVKTDVIDLIESSFNLVNKSQNYDEEIKVSFFIKHREQISTDIYPSELSQVFINIFDNAFYAIRKKINQMEDALRSEYRPTIEAEVMIKDRIVHIKIRDNGSGIPADYLPKIFNSFETSKPPGAGTGLGLSLSREVMTKHQGDIDVSSELGEYTEFVFTLPYL